jgi:hypothetical protein
MPKYIALETDRVRNLQAGGLDAYGQPPQRCVSDGAGNPCRHCLSQIAQGEEMLILAYRPFDRLHAYAETGPIFLCAQACARGGSSRELPDILTASPDYLVRGYDRAERIVYGTGAVVERRRLSAVIEGILQNPGVAFVHLRSARNNCYQVRAERA